MIEILLFAFLNRCRGGFLGLDGSTFARLIYWALPISIWGCFVNPLVGWLCGPFAYVGLLLFGNGGFQNGPDFKNVANGVVIGVARLFLILMPLALINPFVLLLSLLGALQGLAYYIAWKYLDGVDAHISFPGLKLFGKQIIKPGEFAKAAPGWGEVLTGAAYGLAFAIAGN